MNQLARKNVLLDFLSPENHLLYGAASNLPLAQHVRLLCQSLNVAVLLCGDFCLMPPFFPLQSVAVRKAVGLTRDFMAGGVIRIPVRESSLTEFFDKKMLEYSPVKHGYTGLYDSKGRRFVEGCAAAVIKRRSAVGKQLAYRWESGPDGPSVWKPLLDVLPVLEIEGLRHTPRVLKERGESVTWAGINRSTGGRLEPVAFEINQALQHEYAQVYLNEYNATIVAGAPPKTTDLLVVPPDLSYEYWTFRRVLTTLGAWDQVARMPAELIMALKYSARFLEFLALFGEVCRSASISLDVIRTFALLGNAARAQSGVKRIIEGTMRVNPVQWSRGQFDDFEGLFYSTAVLAGHDVRSAVEREGSQPRGLVTGVNVSSGAKIFIVHGRDHRVRDQIDLFLRDKGLQPIVMDRESSSGRTLLEKFEELAAECAYVVVIATPDDSLMDTSGKSVKRLRQNVVLEIGYFWGKNGRRNRFSILLKSDPELEIPSDLSGIGYIGITDDLGQTKLQLEAEMRKANVIGRS